MIRRTRPFLSMYKQSIAKAFPLFNGKMKEGGDKYGNKE